MNASYLAGLFDGEGSVTIRKIKQRDNPTYSLLVQLASNFQPVLYELQSEFGGSVFVSHKTTNPCYHWQITTLKALEFLKIIYPHAKIKKAEIEVAFEYAKVITPGRNKLLPEQVERREDLRQRLIALNQL